MTIDINKITGQIMDLNSVASEVTSSAITSALTYTPLNPANNLTDVSSNSSSLNNLLNETQTPVNASTSGVVTFSQPVSAPVYKKVLIHMLNVNGSASYHFPVAFTHTPRVTPTTSATLLTTLTTTDATVTATATSGFIELFGY